MPRPPTVSLMNPQIVALLKAGCGAKEIAYELKMELSAAYDAITRLDWKRMILSPEEREMITRLRNDGK